MAQPDPALKNRLRTVAKVLPLVMLAAFAIYRLKFAPVPAEILPVNRGPIVSEALGNGFIRAEHHGMVGPRIEGRIVELSVDTNDVVREGDALARLDDSELKAEHESAERAYEAARAAISSATAEKNRTEAVFRQAGRDHARYEALFRERVISEAEYERSAEKLDIARAERDRAASLLNEAACRARDAEKRRDAGKARLDETVVRAPFSGIILSREREKGDVAVPGTTIYQIVDPTDIRVSAWLDETSMAGVGNGKPARVVFHSEPARTYHGSVVKVERDVDPETREILVDVRTDALPDGWAIGQMADVFVERERKDDALVIPSRAVLWNMGSPSVFVLKNSKARQRPVRIGIEGRDQVEIVEGISADDRVVIPEAGVVPGKRVRERK